MRRTVHADFLVGPVVALRFQLERGLVVVDALQADEKSVLSVFLLRAVEQLQSNPTPNDVHAALPSPVHVCDVVVGDFLKYNY